MSESQLEAGKQFVSQQLLRLAARNGVPIERLEWLPADLRAGSHSVAFFAAGKRRVEEFSEENLADAPNTPSTQALLSRRMENLVHDITEFGK